jgi:hypothetical protein
MPTTKTFSLGQCHATQGALGALEDNGTFPIVYLRRHAAGDWGDLGAEDKKLNDAAIQPDPDDCSRILSMYRLPDGQRIYVITEWDRSVTTIMLCSE